MATLATTVGVDPTGTFDRFFVKEGKEYVSLGNHKFERVLTHPITGEKATLSEWARRRGLSASGFRGDLHRRGVEDLRLFEGASPETEEDDPTGEEEAPSRPGRAELPGGFRHGKFLVDPVTGIEDTISGHCRRLGISRKRLHKRFASFGRDNPRAWQMKQTLIAEGELEGISYDGLERLKKGLAEFLETQKD